VNKESQGAGVFYFSRNMLSAFLVVVSGSGLWADVHMPALFSDNMVLQKGVSVPVRGSAEPSEQITVEFAGQRKTVTADRAGKWQIMLDPLPPSAVATELRVRGKNVVTIKNVLVGDVWLASGQSNMEMSVRQAENAAKEMAAANYPNIRFFMVERDLCSAPKEEGAGKWVICTPQSVGPFSAAAFFSHESCTRNIKSPRVSSTARSARARVRRGLRPRC